MSPFVPFPLRSISVGVLLCIGVSFSTLNAARAQPARAASACLPAAAQEQLLLRESALLGRTHAAEHARARVQQCEVERGVRPVPGAGRVSSSAATLQEDQLVRTEAETTAAGLTSNANTQTRQAANTASKQGRWSEPFIIPVTGVTSVLLHTGKVLFWSYDPAGWDNPADSNKGVSFIWDPATRQGYSIPAPENIWCAGQTVLADGRVFLAGGHLRYPDPSAPPGTGGWQGTLTAYTFNPVGEIWVRQPDMVRGRWYPTTTKLADNRVVITSGFDETGSEALNDAVEVFTPAPGNGVGTISVVSIHDPTGLYPFQFVLPSGRMLQAGLAASNSFQLEPGTWNWSSAGTMRDNHYVGGNAISYTDASVTPTKQLVMVAGGESGVNVVASNEWLNGNNPQAGWQLYPQWLRARHNSNTVILPDGKLLTVGGNAGMGNYDGALLQAELYSKPAADTTGTWQQVAPHSIQAAYHSTAILLPDATVLLSQDDMDHSAAAAAQHKAQVYSPPYLFKGAQPKILSAPDALGYGQSFAITADRTGVNSAVLVAPGATTHGNDMHQRVVKLPVTVSGAKLTASVPNSSAILPPGYYMLFVLDKGGIPSIAKFVRVS